MTANLYGLRTSHPRLRGTCSLLLLSLSFSVLPQSSEVHSMLPTGRGNDLWSPHGILVFTVYVRTCGTVMDDADIIANEKYFQEHKVISANFSAAAVTLNVSNLVWPSMNVVVDSLQVYFHVVSKDTTLAGGNVPSVLHSESRWICLMLMAGTRRSQGRSASSTLLMAIARRASHGFSQAPLVPSMLTGSTTRVLALLNKLPWRRHFDRVLPRIWMFTQWGLLYFRIF